MASIYSKAIKQRGKWVAECKDANEFIGRVIEQFKQMKTSSTQYTPLYWCIKTVSRLTNYLIKEENVFERLSNNEEIVQIMENNLSSEESDE